jgi:hypothetical protein
MADLVRALDDCVGSTADADTLHVARQLCFRERTSECRSRHVCFGPQAATDWLMFAALGARESGRQQTMILRLNKTVIDTREARLRRSDYDV